MEERYIFIDKQSGKDFNRPLYQGMLLIIRDLIVGNLDKWVVLEN
ncbi:hypothetical protein [Peribacillus simplex]|nr:hypothetical protein [Peribacillus simplex]